MGTLSLTKRQEYAMGQRACSINGAGKTGQLPVKEWNEMNEMKHFLTSYTKVNGLKT